MAAPALSDLWLVAPEGKLCAREQAKAWALREAWRAEGKGAYGLLSFVAARVKTTRNGKPAGACPTAAAMHQFFEKVDADAEWFPGKQNGEARGPKRVLRGAKRGAIVSAAKRLKAEGVEPTYSNILAASPAATTNPSTQKPVDKNLVYTVFREACYDDDPAKTWDHRSRFSRAALSAEQKEKRLAFAEHMLALPRTSAWYFESLVWCDLCASILPRSKKKAQDMAFARKGGKGWMSQGSEGQSANLRQPQSVLRQNSSDTVKVWWVPILTRGKLHVESLPDNFPGETEAGAAIMVAKVRVALNIRFQNTRAPRLLFTDRGNGFFNAGSGAITEGYRRALQSHSLRAFFARDASVQPGTLQEIMLHETAVAWMRERLKKTLPRCPWEESVDAYRRRLKAAAAHVNEMFDVDGLCRELPQRLKALRQTGGDRIAK